MAPRLRQRRNAMSDHRTRRWFQLSLKSLFLLTLLVATFCAGYTLATRQMEEGLRTERATREKAEVDRMRLELEVLANSRAPITGEWNSDSDSGISGQILEKSMP